MSEVERDLWRPSGPTPLLEKDHLDLVAQEHVQMTFKYHKKGKLHILQGYAGVRGDNFLVTCMGLWFGWNEPFVFQFVQLTSCPVTRNHQREHGSLFLLLFYTHW